MSIKSKNLTRIVSLLVMLFSFIPVQQTALAAAPLPPVDMFQLPWEQGLAWVALDGFDNGSKRAANSPHNYLNGGAVDFAPHNNMVAGENTSNFWVTAAADGTIVETSKCHLKIAHANGWVSEYQHLANFQVKLGDVVARNQKLAVIANATTQPVCAGSEPPNVPHLHFALRPNMVGATFAGWKFNYSSFWNSTSFTKNAATVGLFKPLLNVFDSVPTATPTIIATSTSGGQPTDTPTSMTGTPPPFTATSTPPTGPYVSTSVDQASIQIGETALVTVDLHNVPAEGYNSAEFTCTYNAAYIQTSSILVSNLFGADAAA
ncbi:MAG: M23 family metallopeptidase, partial [Chloroflexota bacterium]